MSPESFIACNTVVLSMQLVKVADCITECLPERATTNSSHPHTIHRGTLLQINVSLERESTISCKLFSVVLKFCSVEKLFLDSFICMFPSGEVKTLWNCLFSTSLIPLGSAVSEPSSSNSGPILYCTKTNSFTKFRFQADFEYLSLLVHCKACRVSSCWSRVPAVPRSTWYCIYTMPLFQALHATSMGFPHHWLNLEESLQPISSPRDEPLVSLSWSINCWCGGDKLSSLMLAYLFFGDQMTIDHNRFLPLIGKELKLSSG